MLFDYTFLAGFGRFLRKTGDLDRTRHGSGAETLRILSKVTFSVRFYTFMFVEKK